MLAALSLKMMDLWPLAAAMAVLVLAATLALYPRQVRALGRPWHWLLPALRAAALGALALSVLRPVLVRSKSVEEHGAVVVLLDRSPSMGVRDWSIGPNEQSKAAGQLVAVADALGLLPQGFRRRAVAGFWEEIQTLDSLADDIARAAREVDYARISGREPREAQQRLDAAVNRLTESAERAQHSAEESEARPEVVRQLAPLARAPRPEERERWIRSLGTDVAQLRADAQASQEEADRELYRTNDTVREICDELSRLSRLELSWKAIASAERSLLGVLDRRIPVLAFAIADGTIPLPVRYGDDGVQPVPVEPAGNMSDLPGGLRQALQRLGRQPVQAVVLFSDGRHVGPQPSFSTGLLPSGVPVFAVSAASEQVRDLAVEAVEAPRSVFVGETLTLRVRGRHLGIDAREIAGEVVLTTGNGQVVSSPVQVKDGKLEPIELPIRLHQPGIHRLVVHLPVQEREAHTGNNSAEWWVKVLSRKLRVAVLSGSPGWDFRYVRNALLRTPFVQMRDALLPSGAVLGMTPQEIMRQDLLILNDIARDALSTEQWNAVIELVSRRGGSVIYIPGLSHLQQDLAGHLSESLLPYPQGGSQQTARPTWRMLPGEKPYLFQAVPAADAQDLEALRLDDDPQISRRRWDELPGFYRYLSMPLLKPNARVLLVERDSGRPLLTESRFGNGRILFLTMNETWRWRHRVGERYQERFWLQLVRYAMDEPYTLATDRLSLDLSRVSAAPDEPIQVRAKLALQMGDPVPETLRGAVLRHGRPVHTFELSRAGRTGDGRYAATLDGLAEGEYEVRVAAPAGGFYTQELRLPIRIRWSMEAEMANLAGDPDFLRGLAEATGGKLLRLDQVPTLPNLLAEARLRQTSVAELPLWSSAYLFLFVLSCLSAEWALRKQFGLA